MSDLEALEQMSKALIHINEAKTLADSSNSKKEIENLEGRVHDVIDGLVSEVGNHQT
jgi:hypothetical protein